MVAVLQNLVHFNETFLDTPKNKTLEKSESYVVKKSDKKEKQFPQT